MREITRFQPQVSESITDRNLALTTKVQTERPLLRLLPIPQEHEMQGRPSDLTSYRTQKLGADLQAVQLLQEEFNTELGIVPDDKTKIKNYNPVLARWKYEQLTTEEEKRDFRVNERQQLETVLRERYRAGISPWEFTVDDTGKLRNKLMPDEPWEDVLERGVLYRREQGSKEQERESQEVVGVRKIQETLGDPSTPVGTRMVIMSGPGLSEGSPYADNFVDDYVKLRDEKTGMPIIQATRYASKGTYADYRHIAQVVTPDYFAEEKGPIDAWLLAHPLLLEAGLFEDADDVFDTLFQRNPESLKEREMQEIIRACVPVMLYLLDAICKEKYEPKGIALAFNALLNTGDKAHNLIKEGSKRELAMLSDQFDDMDDVTLQTTVAFMGMMPVMTIAAGCGESSGFGMGALLDATANSVGQFGLMGMTSESDRHGSLYFECPDCHKTNKRPYGNLLPNCRFCNADVSCDPTVAAKKKALEMHEDKQRAVKLQEPQKAKDAKKKSESLWVVLFGGGEERKAA